MMMMLELVIMMMLLYWSMTLLLVNGHDGGKRSLSFELPAFRRQRAHNGPGFDAVAVAVACHL